MGKKIIGLGELLWDIFPDRKSLGGAPANFAYITTLLGNQGIVASRLGDDAHGREALQRLRALGLDLDHVQSDCAHETGTVQVELDDKGVPQYQILRPVAWDFLEWTADWQNLARNAAAVCFGSLAQRSEASRATISSFLHAATRAVRIFDVNLRQDYYSQDILTESMKLADIVKLNDEELPKVMRLTELPARDEQSSAQLLLQSYDLKLVCITRGSRGSLLVKNDGEISEHRGFQVKVTDTVGSGDAFTAALVHEFLHKSSLDPMNEFANRVGAWVATQAGGMPAVSGGTLEDALAAIR
jgi:fructokinase